MSSLLLPLAVVILIALLSRNTGRKERSSTESSEVSGEIKKLLSEVRSGMNYENRKDEIKAIGGYLVLNIALFLIWPEGYKKALFEHTSNFWGIHLLAVMSIILLASKPRQAEKIGSLMGWSLALAIGLLFLRFFGIGLDPWKDAEEDRASETRTRPAGAAEKMGVSPRYFIEGPYREFVLDQFASDTLLANICAVESDYRHWSDSASGKVLTNRNTNGSEDYGLCQINSVHKPVWDSLGVDIFTPEGNLAFARWLYKRDGTAPWLGSACRWRDHFVRCPSITERTVVASREARRTVLADSLEVVVKTSKKWSEPVSVGYDTYLSRYIPERGDSLYLKSPSGKVYGIGPGEKGSVRHEVGGWRFGVSDTTSADMRVKVFISRVL